jgi:2-iminobutanoate/2-iminopropanoate deaminase
MDVQASLLYYFSIRAAGIFVLMKIIQPHSLPIPKGHHSPAIVHGGLVYVSGQLPMQEGRPFTGLTSKQTEICLQNIKTILTAAGSDMDSILKVSIFLADINNWDIVNEVFARMMGSHRPARIIVPVNKLNYGCAVEMDAIAVINNQV